MNRRKHFSNRISLHRYIFIICVFLFAVRLSAEKDLQGTVTADGERPLAGVLVKAEAKGGIQTVITKTDDAGHFILPELKTDSVLLSVEHQGRLLFRAIVLTSRSPLDIRLPTPIHGKASWFPADLAADSTSGLFVLDTDNSVSKIYVDSDGSHLVPLFHIPLAYFVSSIAASSQSVFVTTNSEVGCVIFRYSLVSKSIESRPIVTQGSCSGISLDAGAIYVVFTDRKEIRRWDNWEALSNKVWSFPNMDSPGPLFFDGTGNRLLLADQEAGKLYSISIANGKETTLAWNIGWANALAADSRHILVASGKKVLFISRSDNRGEAGPTNFQSLPGGRIVGLAVDAGGNLWFADYDHHLIQGPLAPN